MLGAITIAMCCACAAISAFCASLKPVVPITALTPSSRHTARCASVPSGRVKSISTCGVGQAGAQVGGDGHAARAAEEGRGVLAERRAAGDVERAGQHAVVGAAHRLDQHAAHAAGGAGDGDAHRRPRHHDAAPAAGSCAPAPTGSAAAAASASAGAGSALQLLRRVSASGGALREVLKVSIEATNSRSAGSSPPASMLSSASPSKQHDDAAPLRLGALAADREDVVPAVGVEGVGQQRRAEHVAHLRARHAGLDQRRPAPW